MSRYREGSWFAIPLRDGGYALGLVARASRSGVLFGYFFGPHRQETPSMSDGENLTPSDAVLVGKFGHLGLKQGSWPVVGSVSDWDRSEWPMPAFVRYEELTGRSFRVVYDEDDPAKLVAEVPVQPGPAEQGPKDGLMGAGYVEKVLTGLLAGD